MYTDEHFIKAIKTYLTSQGLPDTYKDAYFLRRINVRIRKTKTTDLANYYAHLRSTPDELDQLKKDLSINVTKFFRDVESFKYFENVLIDSLKTHKKNHDKKPFRIWSAGCAIGAEPYSIGIMVDRAIHKYNLTGIDVKVIATDFNAELLAFARTGIYDEATVEDVSPEILGEYFEKVENNQFKIKYTAKKFVDFSHLDLTGTFPYKNLDVIVCRNVLIYFSSEAQFIIFKKFYDCLRTDGLLFIGKTETMHLSYRSNFNNISPRHRVYLKVDPHSLNEEQARKINVCSECGISFIRDLDLKIHFKKHEKERERKRLELAKKRGDKTDFECPHCSKRFITETRYNAHMNIFHKIIQPRDPKDYY